MYVFMSIPSFNLVIMSSTPCSRKAHLRLFTLAVRCDSGIANSLWPCEQLIEKAKNTLGSQEDNGIFPEEAQLMHLTAPKQE